MNQSARRINRLAESVDAKNYLEIGVHRGATFVDVSVDSRTGIDPSFSVSLSELEAEGVNLCESTSDDHFARLSPNLVFDLVFVDGLHHFEQAYRDLCNVLLHSHARSVIIIDDTRPSDAYSAMRNQQHARELRNRDLQVESGSWHGDVFKVVFAIHEFHLGLDYVTVHGRGNPQTIVWRAATSRVPIGLAFNEIAAMSYEALMGRIGILRLTPEDEAIARCLKAVQRAS